jgi:NitT/TauT family transport system substrate-binding protein
MIWNKHLHMLLKLRRQKMKLKKRIIGNVIFILVLSILLSACSGTPVTQASGDIPAAESSNTNGDGTAEQTEFRFGKIQIPGKDGALCGAPIYIAYANGFFAEEGFDVELISADAETRKIGLNNGTIPIVNGDFQFFPSIEQGVNVRVVDGLHNGCIKLVVRPDSDINTAADLAGKTIGVDEIGGTPHQVASVWLEQGGVSALPEDGEVSFVPYSDGNLELEALYNGDIDVAAMWDPLGSVAEKEGKVKVILDISTDPAFAGKYCCFLYASSKVLDEEPEKVAALLRAYHKAQNWIAENPEDAVHIIVDGKYSAIEDVELAVELISHYEYPSSHDHETNRQDVAADVLYFATALYDIGYLTTEPEKFVDIAYEKVDLTLGQQEE